MIGLVFVLALQCVDFLEGSGRLSAEHFRYAHRPDAVGARQPAGQHRSDSRPSRMPGRARARSKKSCTCSETSSICIGCLRCRRSRMPATGAWKGGDLDGAGDARGLGIAGNCIFVGHGNGAGVRHAINIFKIQPNPEKQPPVQVGEIPAMFEGNQGFDDRELRSLVYKTSRGEDRYILVRNAGTNTIGRMETLPHRHEHLPADRRRARSTDFHAQSHEFFLWHDPANPNRVLVYMAIWTVRPSRSRYIPA